MRLLVTGGAGYIGSVLVRYALERGMQVRVLDALLFGDGGLHALGHRVELIEGDIRDGALLRTAMHGIGALVHLAAVANDPSGELDPALTESVNLTSYPALLKAARDAGVRRFINASTFSVYGKADGVLLREGHPLRPLKAYSRCKASSEPFVRDANDTYMCTTNLRLATVCGWSPRMRFDLIANHLVGQAVTRDHISVWGGEQRRPQVHVKDVCAAIMHVLSAPPAQVGGQTYNIGAENTSIGELAQLAARASRRQVDILTEPARDDERDYAVNCDKARQHLGWKPQHAVMTAIEEIAEAHRAGRFADPSAPIFHNVRWMGRHHGADYVI